VKQRSLAEAAKRGEQVSAITTFNAPADPKMSDAIGDVRSTRGRQKKADPVPKLDPLAWTMSTFEERVDFIKAIGRRDIEVIFDTIAPMPMVQAPDATRSLAREPAPGKSAVTPEKFEMQNTELGEGGYDCELNARFQKDVRGTTLEIVPEHMARNAAPQGENFASGTNANDSVSLEKGRKPTKCGSVNTGSGVTLEQVAVQNAAPLEGAERVAAYYRERVRQRYERERKQAWERETKERYRQACWPWPW
jgi:hypothetical protein